jgi:hypothetical protein
VTIFARTLPPPARRRPVNARGRLLGLALAACVAAVLLILAPSASALVTTVGSTTVGVAPPINESYIDGGNPKTYANPSGNPVLHGTGVYAIYWDPDDAYWSEWQDSIDNYFQAAGAASGSLTSVFAVDEQYTDKSNRPASYAQTFKGAYTYTHAYPASGCVDPNPFEAKDEIPLEHGGTPTAVCLTSAQMASAMEAAITQYELPKGLGNVYYLLTPPSVTVCLDGGKATGHCSDFQAGDEESYEHSFCSYHTDINPGGLPTGDANTIVYAVIPWSAGGYGDWRLTEPDQRPGWQCQDGGIDPAGENGGYEFEKSKKRDKKEQEEFEAKNEKEQAEIELAKLLEGPHEEEPNQQECPNTNGDCDYGLSDLIIGQISLQQQDMVTDPLLNAWQDSDHYENTDECRFLFGPVLGGSVVANPLSWAGTLFDQTLAERNYYLNDAFSLAAELLPYPGVPCLNNVNLDPKFTAPNVVNAGEIVGFDGMQSDVALDAGVKYPATGLPEPNYATYTWNFGDGTSLVSGYAPGAPACETPWLSPCAASIFHSYQYGGTYEVTLTVRDVGGNTASVTRLVTVDGPPRPGSPSSEGSSGQSTQSGAGSPSSSSPGGVPAPVAAAAVTPQSLRTALRKGLAVSYSVNEQVAGHFEVLLSRAIAHRLGISGAPAVGLPAGSAAEVVIAKAILVTTKGGHSALHILFSKRTAARLDRLRKVSLMLRLIVRNASSSSPSTTTVLSSFTLTR